MIGVAVNSSLNDLSVLISKQLAGGSGSVRSTFGSKEVAFAWCGPTLNSAVSYINSGVALNRNFTATRVANTTPITAVNDGSEKPVTATLEPVNMTLKTYPGVVEIKTSNVVDSANLGTAIGQALYGQALMALDADLIAALIEDGTELDDTPDLGSIATAQATLMGAGSFGDLVILSPADYATIVGGTGGLITGGNDPRAAQLFVFGAQIVVSSALTEGTAIVMDRTAATAVELDSSPVCLVDVHARLNTTDVVIEAIAATMVTRPEAVVVIAESGL